MAKFISYHPQKHRLALEKLITTTYGDSSFMLDEAYLKWWFLSSPFRPTEQTESDLLVAIYDSELIAFNGHVANQLHWKGQYLPSYWMINTMVHPDFRRGLGYFLMKESCTRYPNVGAISFNSASKPFLQLLKFNLFDEGTMNRAVAVGNKDQFLELPSNELVSSLLRRKSEIHTGETLKILKHEDIETAAQIWESVAPRYGLSTNRTAAFLKWRYLEHPSQTYKVVCLSSKDQSKAIAVIRIDGHKIHGLRIIDLFGEEEAIPSLLTAILAYGRKERCAFIDFYCTGYRDKLAFENVGFRWLSTAEKDQIPFLLNPPVFGRVFHENLAFNFTTTDLQAIGQMEETYFTKGDSDRDRPQ